MEIEIAPTTSIPQPIGDLKSGPSKPGEMIDRIAPTAKGSPVMM